MLCKPIINFFATEYESINYKKVLQKLALDKNNDIKQVILGTIDAMKELNPEALECTNGRKVVKPQWMLERLEKHREYWREQQEKEKLLKPEDLGQEIKRFKSEDIGQQIEQKQEESQELKAKETTEEAIKE